MSRARASRTVLLSALVLAGCLGGSRLDWAGAPRPFEPGRPSFAVDALPTRVDGAPAVTVVVGVVPAGLVFLPDGAGFAAPYEVLYRHYDARGKTLLGEHASTDTLRAASIEATQAFAPVVVRDTLATGPGRTQIEVILTDLGTRRQTRQRLAVDVPAFDGARAVLGPVRLAAAQGGGGFVARPGPDLAAGPDSLRATAELFDGRRMGEGRIVWRLLQIPADTAVAAAPYLLRAPARLLRYDAPETLLVQHGRVDPAARRQEVGFSLPALPRGIYRIEVEAGPADGHRLRGQRDVAVRSAGFPRITRLEEMIEALAYLARPREHARLMEPTEAEEQRRRFDAFWGRLVPDRQHAAALLQQYYERVEEANLRFTTYKEGWRTDRGMVFVILGEPILIDDRLDREVWHYSYDDRDALSTFVFHRRPLVGSGGRYQAYLLEREFFHEAAWRRALDRWRRGEVL